MKKLIALICVFGLQANQQLEQEKVASVQDWLKKEKDLILSLVLQDAPLHEYEMLHKKNNELLKNKGIVNYSRSNYVFVCPVLPEYMIKISGPVNRLVNTIIANDQLPQFVSDEDIKSLKKVLTSQTVSSYLTYICYLLKNEAQWKNVYIPRTYLIDISGNSEQFADLNSIILQERVELNKVILKDLKQEILDELRAVITQCGLWDIKNKIYMDPKGRLVIVDLEQPNNSNPLKQLSMEKFENNALCGLNALEEELQLD